MTLLEENIEKIANILQEALDLVKLSRAVRDIKENYDFEDEEVYVLKQELALKAEQIEFEKLKLQKEKEEFLKNK